MPLKVCLYMSCFGPGGAERQIVNLAGELSSRGVQVILLHFQPDIEQAFYLEDIIKEKKVEIINAFSPVFFKEGMRLVKQHEDFFQKIPAPHAWRMGIVYLAGAFSLLRPHVVHSYLDGNNCTAGCAAFLAGTPVYLASFRNEDPETQNDKAAAQLTFPIYGYLVEHGYPHFEANSIAGIASYARWLNIDHRTIAYSPNGLDSSSSRIPLTMQIRTFREALSIPLDAPVLLTLSRFVWAKSPESMPDIFSRVLAVRPDCHYIIAGSGMTQDGEMGELIRKQDLERHVHLLGARRDVASLFACADVFLLPSRVEGFPNAIMEAMAAGLPVVASNVGGIPDLVRQGQDGFLYAADDKEGMARAVATLLDDEQLRIRLGTAGRQRILEEFTLQKLGQRTHERYETLLAEATRQG